MFFRGPWTHEHIFWPKGTVFHTCPVGRVSASLITFAIRAEANKSCWIISVLLPFCYCWVNEAAIGCNFPTASNLRGHSQEGDIHHSDMWMLWGKESGVCMCDTVLMYQTLSSSSSKSQAVEVCIVLVTVSRQPSCQSKMLLRDTVFLKN